MLSRHFKAFLFVMVVLLIVGGFLFKFKGTENVEEDHEKATMILYRILELSQSKDNCSQEIEVKVPSHIQESDLENMNSSVSQDLISRIKITCRDSICSEFLTKADKLDFDFCIRWTWKDHVRYREPKDSVCRFINGTGRYPTALASYRGSGNTWVRGLIQSVTGLCTGAFNCDDVLRRTGFPGESIRSGIVLVVKTHFYNPRWAGVYYDKSAPFDSYYKTVEHIPVYSSAIFLLRNPFDSLVAEYSRHLRHVEGGSDCHTFVPKREVFGTNTIWNNFVHEQAVIWEQTALAWIINNRDHPVLIVKYEDLKNNTQAELKRMLDFLQVPYSSSRLKEVVARGYHMYKRKRSESFDHYTPDQRDTVRAAIERVSQSLRKHDLLDKANVSEYLL